VRYLTEEHIDMVLDATHPFTAQMPGHAHDACRAAGVPRLRVRRPGWREAPGDVWHRVPDYAAAVAELRALGPRRVFLTIGRQNVEPFASMAGTWFLVRSIQDPEWPGPAGATVLLDRGPFTEDRERVLLAAHGIDAVVTKDSGGQAAVAKLAAAREMHVPVVMIDRPPPPPGPLATTVDEALAWCRAQAAQAG
jgi:precorrin-6A/cobalt-precorrin-6A reductase